MSNLITRGMGKVNSLILRGFGRVVAAIAHGKSTLLGLGARRKQHVEDSSLIDTNLIRVDNQRRFVTVTAKLIKIATSVRAEFVNQSIVNVTVKVR